MTPKKVLSTGLTIAGFIIVSGAVVTGTFYSYNHFFTKTSTTAQSTVAQCTRKGAVHTVAIQNDVASPKHTDGLLCDTLTITNYDSRVRLIAFGEHDNHQPYDGVEEKELAKDQSLTITLNQAGTFEFHDHIGDIVQGDFTVTK